MLRVADTQTDGKWVVLAPAFCPPLSSTLSSSSDSNLETSSFVSSDLHSPNIMQLYRLSLPSSSSAPKLVFVRNLVGPMGPVSALALADGRCVGLGGNGCVWVWDLESGRGVEVAGARERVGSWERGSIAFDERRIVSAGPDGDGVVARRFDI